jgi:hypothetical protein
VSELYFCFVRCRVQHTYFVSFFIGYLDEKPSSETAAGGQLVLEMLFVSFISQTYSSPVMSPVTVPNASMTNQSKGAARQVTNLNADKGSLKGDQEAVPRPSTPRSRDESYSETFQSSSHMDNDAVNGHVGSANDNRGMLLISDGLSMVLRLSPASSLCYITVLNSVQGYTNNYLFILTHGLFGEGRVLSIVSC